MSVTRAFLVVIFVCMALCAECYIRPATSSRSMASLVRSPITQLRGMLHEAAEAGDMETVMKIIKADPKLVNKFDIDG
jgi:hypothetical protein